MNYLARLNDDRTYSVENDGVPVADAEVLGVIFPKATEHTIHGSVHHISGDCLVTISLPNGETIENVPLVQ